MIEIPAEAVAAAHAARYGEPVDTYTWDLVADKVLVVAAPHIAAAVAEEFRGPIVWLIGLQDGMHKVYANQPDWDRLRENLNKACLDLTSLLPENQPGAES